MLLLMTMENRSVRDVLLLVTRYKIGVLDQSHPNFLFKKERKKYKNHVDFPFSIFHLMEWLYSI